MKIEEQWLWKTSGKVESTDATKPDEDLSGPFSLEFAGPDDFEAASKMVEAMARAQTSCDDTHVILTEVLEHSGYVFVTDQFYE